MKRKHFQSTNIILLGEDVKPGMTEKHLSVIFAWFTVFSRLESRGRNGIDFALELIPQLGLLNFGAKIDGGASIGSSSIGSSSIE